MQLYVTTALLHWCHKHKCRNVVAYFDLKRVSNGSTNNHNQTIKDITLNNCLSVLVVFNKSLDKQIGQSFYFEIDKDMAQLNEFIFRFLNNEFSLSEFKNQTIPIELT